MALTSLPTAEEVAELDPEGRRYGLIRGQVREDHGVGGRHGRIAFRFGLRVGLHVERHGLGTVFSSVTRFVILRDPDVTVAPDVAFVRADRLQVERPGSPPLILGEGDELDGADVPPGFRSATHSTVNPRRRHSRSESTMATTALLTAEDLERLGADFKRLELVFGVLREKDGMGGAEVRPGSARRGRGAPD